MSAASSRVRPMSKSFRTVRFPIVATLALTFAACATADDHVSIADTTELSMIGTSRETATRVGVLDGFYGPESVKYDADQDVWFISNMMGPGSAKDGVGWIDRVN